MQRLGRLRSIWRSGGRDLLSNQGVVSLEGVTPLFECKPPLSARWTWPLVTAQMIIFAAGVELTMQHWTRPVESEDDTGKKPAVASPSTNVTTSNTEPEYELRPLEHRIALVGIQSVASAIVCVILFRSRARTLRRLYVVPRESLASDAPFLPKFSKKHNRALILQNVWQWRGQGRVVPFAGHIERGMSDLELTISIPTHGRYTLPLGDAKVNGAKYDSQYSLREALYTTWYGQQNGIKEMAKTAWQTEF